MVDLFKEYPSESEENKKIDLFKEYNPENMPGTEEEALELAKKRISAQHPNLPNWLRDAILSITPREKSPLLESAARGVSNVTNYIPAVAGGLLQGASIPIRGVSGLIPTEFTQKLARSPDLTTVFPPAETEGQKNAQFAAEILGGGSLFGKLFQGAKYGAQAIKLPNGLQNATALTTAGAIGTPGDIGDRALGAGGALALGAAGKANQKLVPFARGLFNQSTPETLVSSVQKPHDILQSTADEFYNQVKGAIKKRNIKVPMKKEYLEQAKEYFPERTTATKELFERAKNGDYDAIHTIQSSLYKKGTKQSLGDDLVKENEGEEILDLRDKMNNFFESHLIQEGHIDIAHLLKQGKNIYSDLQKTYYNRLLPKGIGKLVHPETRLLPENPESLFKQNSVPMKRFFDKHPETLKHVHGLKEKKEAYEALKKLLYISGGTGASIVGSKTIYDLFK